MNYGEEWAYWYLRLNGFFPINNFVVHRAGDVEDRADIDLLAIRPAHVFEEIGGREDDWDPFLRDTFDLSRPLGLICEVKTGAIKEAKLFRPEVVDRAVKRLGLVPLTEVTELVAELQKQPVVRSDHWTIAKVLMTTDAHEGDGYFNLTRNHVNGFVEDRVRRYSGEKFNSRHFFPSNLFQDVTHRIHDESLRNGG